MWSLWLLPQASGCDSYCPWLVAASWLHCGNAVVTCRSWLIPLVRLDLSLLVSTCLPYAVRRLCVMYRRTISQFIVCDMQVSPSGWNERGMANSPPANSPPANSPPANSPPANGLPTNGPPANGPPIAANSPPTMVNSPPTMANSPPTIANGPPAKSGVRNRCVRGSNKFMENIRGLQNKTCYFLMITFVEQHMM